MGLTLAAGLEDALVGAREVDEHGDGRVNARALDRVDLGLAQRGRHRAQAEHRPVLGGHRRVGLLDGDVPRVHVLVQLVAQDVVVRRPA